MNYYLKIKIHDRKAKYKLDSLIKGKKFITKCLIGSFNLKKKQIKYHIQKITVVIPVYNAQKFIINGIRSIQNQKMKEIEIILVNDFSKDNSLLVIKELQKQDQRILIINNNKSMGTLYSRCIGTLLAKGQYILPLDNDDMFFSEDLFDTVFEISSKNNIDILEFNGIINEGYDFDVHKARDYKYFGYIGSKVIKQPELSFFLYRDREFTNEVIIDDIYLWGKSIKKEVYQKAINRLGKERYSRKIIWSEDLLMSFILFKTAQSFMYINKYGIFFVRFDFSFSANCNTIEKTYSKINVAEIYFDFSENTFQDKKLAAISIINICRYYKDNDIIEEGKTLLLLLLKKILKCKYINEKTKTLIKNKCFPLI